MLNKQSLYSLFDLEITPHSPVIEIYAEQITPRLRYTCQFVFNHILNCQFKITDRHTEFENIKTARINYSSRSIDNTLQIIPCGLLAENGIREIKPDCIYRNDMLYFYPSREIFSESNTLHFDIFSAVFYCISRMEEWQGFEPDTHLRFEAASSIFFKEQFHLKPVVDIWVHELKQALEKSYSGLKFPEKKFRVISTIDVDNLYAFKAKGVARTLGACARDLLKLDLKNFKLRLQVLSGRKQDPFDVYEFVSGFCFEQRIPLIYFFLFKTGTRHDRTVDPRSGAFQEVFQTLKKNHALFGLHPSYNSVYKDGMLREEISDLNKRSAEAITLSRQHYLRFDIRTTPALLLQNGIIADFTMGFASSPGFRAGTSRPFYYYDFNSERISDLLFVPFCAMDGAYTIYDCTNPARAMDSMFNLAKEVKKVEGLYITVFHERTFFDHLYMGFGTLYKNLHLKLKEL